MSIPKQITLDTFPTRPEPKQSLLTSLGKTTKAIILRKQANAALRKARVIEAFGDHDPPELWYKIGHALNAMAALADGGVINLPPSLRWIRTKEQVKLLLEHTMIPKQKYRPQDFIMFDWVLMESKNRPEHTHKQHMAFLYLVKYLPRKRYDELKLPWMGESSLQMFDPHRVDKEVLLDDAGLLAVSVILNEQRAIKIDHRIRVPLAYADRFKRYNEIFAKYERLLTDYMTLLDAQIKTDIEFRRARADIIRIIGGD